MKFFHLSDLHIGQRLLGRDMTEERQVVLEQIVQAAKEHRPDAIVIAGDLYDRAVPGTEAVAQFDSFLGALTNAVPESTIMMISGNHDSPVRVNAYRGLLEQTHVYMIGLPPQKPGEHIEKVTLQDAFGAVNFYLLPFIRPGMVRKLLTEEKRAEPDAPLSYEQAVEQMLMRESIDDKERNVLVSHQFYLPIGTDAEQVERADTEVRTVGNIDAISARVLEKFDYAALGHIHKPMTVGEKSFRYCGSPQATSISEAGQQKGILLVELGEKGTLEISTLPLKSLHPVRTVRGTLEEVTAQPSEDLVSVTLTDPADLDIFDMRDRLRAAFPNLLETRRESPGMAAWEEPVQVEQVLDPYALCCGFLGDVNEEQSAILRAALNAIGEVE